MFRTGYRRQLDVQDIFDVCPSDKSDVLGDNLEKYVFTSIHLYMLRLSYLSYGLSYTSGVTRVVILYEIKASCVRFRLSYDH